MFNQPQLTSKDPQIFGFLPYLTLKPILDIRRGHRIQEMHSEIQEPQPTIQFAARN